ncbi:MAG: UrcA family protein [Sphingomonadales bacterium]|nr:UrcA family protein [Sphingomonadales bacterium]
MFKTAIAAALAGALTLSAAAHAEAPALELRFGDLDLSSEAGKAELSRRIARVATAICEQGVQTGTLLAGNANAKCRADARAALADRVARAAPNSGLGG